MVIMKKNLTFEQALKRLDEIVETLGSGDTTLDASLALYAEGAELLSFCEGKLGDAKLKIETLFPESENKKETL